VARKDLLTRLADAGEEAIAKLADAPGMKPVTNFANTTRDRLDELSRRVRGIDELERRVAALEKQLDETSGTAPANASGKKKTTTATKGSSAKSGGGSSG
jgi:hypothetical protein